MEERTFNAELLEGNYLIGDTVQMKDGVIADNPFSKEVGKCLAAQWFLDNEELVKNKIRNRMNEEGMGTSEVSECFDYAVYFFLERPEKDFKPNYFGSEGTGTYTIEIYCLSQIRHIVRYYRNEAKKRMKAEVHLVEIDKDSDEPQGKKCISFDALNKARSDFDDVKDSFGVVDDVVEFDELQDILDEELPFYDEEFETLGFHEFDFRQFVYHMFLSDREVLMESSRLSDIDEDVLEEVADDMEMTVSSLKAVTGMLQEAMKNHRGILRDVPELVARLVKGKLQGWTPQV